MRHLWLACLLAGIACGLGFTATRAAGIRRVAEARLRYCRKNYEPERCFEEARDYCTAQGLERTCGEGWP